MTPSDTQHLGPIDYLLVELPDGGASFDGRVVAELASLEQAGTIRLLDLLILRKAMDGSVEAIEVVGDDAALGEGLVGLLGAEDVAHFAWAMEPGTVAAVVAWENLWTAPFLSALRGTGGRPVAGGRIRVGAIAAAVESGPGREEHGPLPPRGLRRGVMGSPVARTAETADTEAIAARGLEADRERITVVPELAR